MEIFELRYFLAVARTENVNRAAELIHVSPGSLSKAISRLEEELQVPLFFKQGRGIRLTPQGLLLKARASRILQLEEDARVELSGKASGALNVYVASEEVLQASFGPMLARKLHELFPEARLHFGARAEEAALSQVADGEAHLALTTADPPIGLEQKILGRATFLTCASSKHPLARKFGSKEIPVRELLKYPFAAPDTSILGYIAKSSSPDGWRDDKFPRDIKFRVSGLKLLECLIEEGSALGYLPDYFVKTTNLKPLKITGCPYTCNQTVRIVCKDPGALGWLSRLWDTI